MSLYRQSLIAVVIAVILGGCASRGPIGPLATPAGPTSAVQLVGTGPLPPPTSSDFEQQFRPYQIAPFDVLEVDVFGIEALQRREFRVDSAGRISVPLVGEVDSAGLSLAELEAELTSELRAQFVRDPRVTVNLKETTSRTVTVTGEVTRPGIYPVLTRMTLVGAVATAGGFGDFAQYDEVIVFRDVNGQRMAGVYNLAAIQRGNYDDPEIYPNDVVVVGDSPQRRMVRDLIGVAPAILAPLIVTLL